MLIELLSNVTVLSVILFIIGLLLLVLEMIQPGFGVFGLLGIAVLTADVFVTAKTTAQALFMVGILVAVVLILLIVCIILASKGILPKNLVLKNSSTKDDGYSATVDYSSLVGMEGITVTDLHPAGKATINENSYDVVSEGEFIENNSPIVVSFVSGNRIVVKQK